MLHMNCAVTDISSKGTIVPKLLARPIMYVLLLRRAAPCLPSTHHVPGVDKHALTPLRGRLYGIRNFRLYYIEENLLIEAHLLRHASPEHVHDMACWPLLAHLTHQRHQRVCMTTQVTHLSG